RVIALKWSDPLGAASNDYDLFVLDASGTTILTSSTTMQSGSQDPYELIICTPSLCPPGAMVVVALYSGAPRALRLQVFGQSTAAAHAAGIAALVKGAKQSASTDVIRNALLASALDIEVAGNDITSGAGIVMAAAAVRSVLTPLVVDKRFVTSPMPPGATAML